MRQLLLKLLLIVSSLIGFQCNIQWHLLCKKILDNFQIKMGQSSKSKYSINPILFSMILCAGISGINSSEANGSGKGSVKFSYVISLLFFNTNLI